MSYIAKKRIDELDSLRGIAAVIVLLYHYIFRFNELFGVDLGNELTVFSFGHYGVHLFFVISGFVIFMSVDKISNPYLFLFKRFIRLFPTFWIAMIFSYIFVQSIGPDILKVGVKDFLINFTMIPSVFGARSVDGVYWTLKIELFFYLFVFILLFFKAKEKYLYIGYFYLVIGVFSFFVLRPTLYYYYGLLFLVGINFYKIWSNASGKQNHIQIISCFCLVMCYNDMEIITVTSILLFIFYLLSYDILKFLNISTLVFFGKISYPLYLIHQYVGYSIQLKFIDLGVSNSFILIASPLLFSIVIASIISFYLEQPIINFLNKRNPIRATLA